MKTRARVFLDTSVVKLAADRVIRGFQRAKTFIVGDQTVRFPVTQFRFVPKVPRPGTPQAADAATLRFISYLATRNRIELLWHLDGWLELIGLPNTDSPDGRFFGAPMTDVHGPPPWGRSLGGMGRTMREDQEAYLKGRRDKRFMELQRAVGVKAGANNAANQRADAWHLYCAEYEKASHFLTVDYRMIRHLQSHRSTTPKLKVVTPRELLTDLRQTRNIRWFDDAGFLLERLILRFRPTPPAHGAEQLVVFGETLERAGYYDPWNT